MQPMPQRRPPVPRTLPWLVLAAHLLALLLIGQALRPRDRAPAATTRPLWLRLLPEPARRPADEPGRAMQTRPALRPEPRAATRAAPDRRPHEPARSAQAITLPAAETPAAALPPEPPSSAPLNLRLAPGLRTAPPPPSALARDDPRANSSRGSSEQRMARTLGTDQVLREGVLPDGTRSFRRGRDCVLARPARESQLNPYNQSMNPTPRLIDDC